MPCAEILPIFPPSVLVTLQLTGTVVPVETEAKAVQASVSLEETIDAGFPEESLHMTAVIAVAATIVRLAVAVSVDCTWEVAVIVTTLVLGTFAGAVYIPPLVIEPLPVPLTDQFTRVLLAFKTLAVHCAVPSTVTSDPVPWLAVHVAVMVGVTAVVLADPQELRTASATVSPKKKRTRSQRILRRPKWKFGSSTRNPPARTTLIFLRNTRSHYASVLSFLRQDKQVEPAPFRWSEHRILPSEGTHPFAVRKCLTLAKECPAHETVFSLCRRNPASAHLQPTWWQAV